VIEFPSTNVQIQDICLSRDGSRLFVVALDGNNSQFATATLTNPVIWSGPFTATNSKFVSLARPTSTDRLLAIKKAQGLFEINLGLTSVNPILISAFNATGLLAVNENNFVFAAFSNNAIGVESTNFDGIRRIGPQTSNFPLQGIDADDDLIHHNNTIYYTGRNPTGIRVLAGVRQVSNPTPTIISPVALPEQDPIMRLAAVRQNSDTTDVLVSFSDQSRVLRVFAAGGTFNIDDKYFIPVQLFPMAMATDTPREQMVYALNTFVNTITTIEVTRVLRSSPPNYIVDREIVADYRDAVLEAYKGLLMRLLQYLKDCFCDKFLIDCPQCTEKNKVYLGTIEIHNSEIYHICNFSKRKYVKTFRTVGYWLSVIPVANLIKKAFTVFCCTVLDDLGKKTP
jgi:hypothetical protein